MQLMMQLMLLVEGIYLITKCLFEVFFCSFKHLKISSFYAFSNSYAFLQSKQFWELRFLFMFDLISSFINQNLFIQVCKTYFCASQLVKNKLYAWY